MNLAAKRVAIASRTLSGLGGAATYILEHARRMRALGWEVHLYGETLDSGRIASAGAVGHRLPRWPFGSFFKRRLFAWLFERAARGRGYDLVCGHGDVLEQDVLFLHNCVHAAHEAVRRVPLPDGSGVGVIHSRILRERRFRLLIANSRLMAEDVQRRFGVPPEMVQVVHPGYDPERFRPSDREKLGPAARRELGVEPSDLLVGLITSGDFAKRGVGIFLGALGRLPARLRQRTHAVVIGREARLAPYLRAAQTTGLGARVHFLPPTPFVARWYHALDVYVYPALFEEFGMSVLEAMACAAPVLTTPRVGAAELLQGNSRGMLLDRPDEEPFARRLEALLGDPALRRRWGDECARACPGNTWDDNFKRALACYESVAASRLREKTEPGAAGPRVG